MPITTEEIIAWQYEVFISTGIHLPPHNHKHSKPRQLLTKLKRFFGRRWRISHRRNKDNGEEEHVVEGAGIETEMDEPWQKPKQVQKLELERKLELEQEARNMQGPVAENRSDEDVDLDAESVETKIPGLVERRKRLERAAKLQQKEITARKREEQHRKQAPLINRC